MTKKDYVLIATIIRSLESQDRFAIARRFAFTLMIENPRFNMARFMDACVPEKKSDAV